MTIDNLILTFFIRAQCFQLSSTEALQNVDAGKQLTDYSVESGKSDALFQNGLINALKDVDTNDSLQTEPCVSSGDVDEYLADPVDTECVHSSHIDTPNLKRSDDKHESLLCSSCDPETTMLKSDYRDGVGTVEIPLVSEGAENEIGREPTFDGMAVNIEEEPNDSEWPCNEFSNMKSGLHFSSTAMNPHQDLNTQVTNHNYIFLGKKVEKIALISDKLIHAYVKHLLVNKDECFTCYLLRLFIRMVATVFLNLLNLCRCKLCRTMKNIVRMWVKSPMNWMRR